VRALTFTKRPHTPAHTHGSASLQINALEAALAEAQADFDQRQAPQMQEQLLGGADGLALHSRMKACQTGVAAGRFLPTAQQM
jgi:hypothetical protein